MIKVYLAGPDVFRTDSIEYGNCLKQYCEKCGLQGLYPMDNVITGTKTKRELGKKIAEANVAMINSCDYVLANLTPFRGPSADPGTVWECAYAKALGKKVWGYSFDNGQEYKSKVLGKIPHDGMTVEDFEAFDNIMIVHNLDEFFPIFNHSQFFSIFESLGRI